MENNFSQIFDEMIMFGALGVYQRDSTKEIEQTALSSIERLNNCGLKAIHKATGIGTYLNVKYRKEFEGRRIFPQTEYDLFLMFSSPIYDLIGQLPECMQSVLKDNAEYIGIEPLFSITGDGTGVTTEELEYFIASMSFDKVCKCKDLFGELREQQIFQLMYDGDYNFIRTFLEAPENVAIPIMQLEQSDEQKQFISENQKLFGLCYSKETKKILYRCPKCKAILQEDKIGRFSCLRSLCNSFLDGRKPLKSGPYYVMNPYVVKSIYHPGILERKIREILDEKLKVNVIAGYELWPGEYYGDHDTWDFKVKLLDGTYILVDAKDVKSAHWLINDKRKLQGETPFWYVVPNSINKSYLDQVNGNSRIEKQVQCMRLKTFSDKLEALRK